MKRHSIKFFLILITLIGTLFVSNTMTPLLDHEMQAAGLDFPMGVKLIDIFLGRGYQDLFGIDENRFLYKRDSANSTMSLVKDKNGEPLHDIIAFAGSSENTTLYDYIALRSDGMLYVWGKNTYGEFGNGTKTSSTTPILVDPGVPDVVGVASLQTANLLVTKNGDVYAAGDNSKGQFGNGTTDSSTTFVKTSISDVKKVVRGGNANAYALKNDGTVWGWGNRVYNGKDAAVTNVTEPIQLYQSDTEVLTDVVDIDNGYRVDASSGLAIVTLKDGVATGYLLGYATQAINGNQITLLEKVSVSGVSEVGNVSYGYHNGLDFGLVVDNELYTNKEQPFRPTQMGEGSVVKGLIVERGNYVLSKSGALYKNSTKFTVGVGFGANAYKENDSSLSYANNEKYNGRVDIETTVASDVTVTCKVEDPVGSTAANCSDYANKRVTLEAQEQRINRKYILTGTSTKGTVEKTFLIDIYRKAPQLQGFSTSSTNQIQENDKISLAVPSEESGWNTYTATITDDSGNTTDYHEEAIPYGSYTLHVSDSYGNTADYVFETTAAPTPTVVFTPSAANFVYNDSYTKVNGTVGTFSLQYPEGKVNAGISSITLGSDGDEALFSVDTTGALKVKGNDLNAGTYHVSVNGKDGNQVDFTKTVEIVVNKADQNQYQITNNANYVYQANQEIAITTSGNVSGESETYTITQGNSVAQIVSGKFKMLSVGTFTIEATVAGNQNYNPKTVSKQITIADLPAQTPGIHITSADTMTYGDTYTPSVSGGQGSGAITWTIEADNGTGATIQNGKVTVSGIGSFTLKAEKAGDGTVQASADTLVITVNKRKITVKPNEVTKYKGQEFKDNGVTYTPQPVNGDSLGTALITSKYPKDQSAGCYRDGIQVSGLSNPNYEFVYQDGTLNINDFTISGDGAPYYTISGTKGNNGWYISDIQIAVTGKDGFDEISLDGTTYQKQPIVRSEEGAATIELYFRKSSDGTTSNAVRVSVKIDKTAPTVPVLTMKEINQSRIARAIQMFSFGQWMNKGIEVTMTSTDAISGMDHYEYEEISSNGNIQKQSVNGIVTYEDETEITLRSKACDKAGNCSSFSDSEQIMIDLKAPVITGVKDQSVYKQYYIPRFVMVKEEGSGLAQAYYKKDGVLVQTLMDSVEEKIKGEGSYEIYAIDNAGNDSTITFKIVALPDIDTEIDGSDESKDIIDQIKQEYEEVKDKLDEEERSDYEQWIEDATKKWEDSRKTVLETEDKTAKVEGQGDVSFDPSIELIVDPIESSQLPKLPKKALHAYDVYLLKDNVVVQPNGSIKVYLPYKESEEPIVYQIEEDGNVREISAVKEGNYVTFVTDQLEKYAISNIAQPDHSDNVCVVGPDGAESSGDEVCGKPSDDGKQPVKESDGSVKVPEGGSVEFPNGTILPTPDGAIIKPDGTVILPDGTEYDANGNKKEPEDTCRLEGKDINVDTDGDGLPDLNLDIDGDCIADLNIDTNFDNIPDIDIDTTGDGKADINVDANNDGKADLNIAVIKRWIPDKNYNYQGFAYDTGEGFIPYLNNDDNGDGIPDRNIDDDGDGIPDRNIDPDWFDKYGNGLNNQNTGANTGDTTKWIIWWIILILTGIMMGYSQYMKRKNRE